MSITFDRVFDNDTIAAFQRDGFLKIDQLVPLAEIARIKDILVRLHENNVGFNEGAQFDAVALEDDPKNRRFPQIIRPHVYAKELTKTQFFTIGQQIARELLGDKARFNCDISFLKPAGIGSGTPWHQDEAYGNPAFDRREITIWLAVTPANTANSCMSFIPGSNLHPVLDHQPLGGNARLHALECIGDFDASKAVECALQAGDCTIHTNRTLHSAGPNTSNDFRLGYALLFDTPPTPQPEPRVYAWRKPAASDRAVRQQTWQRRGGVIVHAWRQRHRLPLDRMFGELLGRALQAWRIR